MFLKTLDSMPRPPSLASNAQSRAYLPSTSSSLSNPRHSVLATSDGLEGSGQAPVSASGAESAIGSTSAFRRKRMTKTQATEALNNMASSYTLTGQPFAQPGNSPLTGSALATSSSVSPIDRLAPSTVRTVTTNRLMTPLSGASAERGTGAIEEAHRSSMLPATSRETGLVGRMGSSVKSSSPLAQAPIQATSTQSQRIDSRESDASLPLVEHAGCSGSPQRKLHPPLVPERFDLPDQQGSDQSEQVSGRHVQSLPGNGPGVGLYRKHSLPPPLPCNLTRSGDIASQPVPIRLERDSKRRVPVLQRGGFNQLMSLGNDNTSAPEIGITSVSVGGSTDNVLGSSSPGTSTSKKISRSAPGRDPSANPKIVAHNLKGFHPPTTASPSSSPLGSPHARVAETANVDPGFAYGRARSPSVEPHQSIFGRTAKAAMLPPSMIRAISGDLPFSQPVGTPSSMSNRNQFAQDDSKQSCTTAPASPTDRTQTVGHHSQDRRWISESHDIYKHLRRQELSTETAEIDEDDSVIGDLEMSDCNEP
jgi:hypothetical protein